jgi:hypothetical protein
MVKLYVRNMLAGVGRWQLTCAEVATSAVASEAEVDYQMDAAAHAERP